jgi:hypothetical protein
MDAPRAYGFHGGLPWPHRGSLGRMETKRGRSRAEQDSGEAILPATRGAAVTWREETRSAGRAKRSLEVIACTARLNESAYPREEKSAVWQSLSRDEPSTSSRKRFALDQIVGNRRKLRSRFNSGTLPQTTETGPLSQRGRTSETITDFLACVSTALVKMQ